MKGIANDWGYTSFASAAFSSKLWKYAKELDQYEFKDAIERLLETSYRQPNIGQIRSSLTPAMNRAWARNKQKRVENLRSRGQACKLCDLTGRVVAREIETGYEYAFICTACDVAKIERLSFSLPPWDAKRYGFKFEIVIQKIPKATRKDKDGITVLQTILDISDTVM
jgi:hypothetical protein